MFFVCAGNNFRPKAHGQKRPWKNIFVGHMGTPISFVLFAKKDARGILCEA